MILAELLDVKDAGSQQSVSHHGLAGEKHSEVLRLQLFGTSSHPPPGSAGLVASLGGERSRSIFLGGEHDGHRPRNLKPGEVKHYDAFSQTLHFSEDGVTLDLGERKKPFVVTVGEVRLTAAKDKIVAEIGQMKIILSKDRIDLGGEGGRPVATLGGYSSKVFAAV